MGFVWGNEYFSWKGLVDKRVLVAEGEAKPASI